MTVSLGSPGFSQVLCPNVLFVSSQIVYMYVSSEDLWSDCFPRMSVHFRSASCSACHYYNYKKGNIWDRDPGSVSHENAINFPRQIHDLWNTCWHSSAAAFRLVLGIMLDTMVSTRRREQIAFIGQHLTLAICGIISFCFPFFKAIVWKSFNWFYGLWIDLNLQSKR